MVAENQEGLSSGPGHIRRNTILLLRRPVTPPRIKSF